MIKKQIGGMFIYVYYLVMLIVLLSWNNGEVAPPMAMRLVYLAFILFPVFFIRKYIFYYPIVLTVFVSISKFMFSFSYMPTDVDIYAMITILWFAHITINGWCPFKNSGNELFTYLLFSVLYISVIDFFDKGTLTPISYCIVIILILLSSIKSRISTSLLLTSFSIVSFVLSLAFLLLREQYALDYYSTTVSYSGIERSSWTDPNYFGCLIGFGIVTSLIKLRSFATMKMLDKVFYIAVCVLSFLAIVINASRGAVLAVGIAFIVYIFFTHSQFRYKLIVVLGILILLWLLYTNDYFELLFYRIESDSGSGSGRTDIWAKKMNSFMSGNGLNILFGYGNQGGVNLGFTYARGFHNDFIAILVEYGVIGFIMFVGMFIKPLIKASKMNGVKSASIVILSYLFTVMMTLEPLTIGYIPYWLIIYLFFMVSTEKRILT